MSTVTGLTRYLSLANRRYRWQAIAWMLPLWAFLLLHPIALERFYPSSAERSALLAQMRNAPGVSLLFGPVPNSAELGSFVSWLDGAYILYLVAIMAIMLTTALARRDEQEGLVEVALGAGAGRWTPFASAALWLLAVMTLTGAGTTVSLVGVNSAAGQTPLPGSIAFGGVVAAQGLAFCAISLILCQLVPDVSTARGLGLAVFGASFALRVLADKTGLAWVRWLSPTAWRDIVNPFDGLHAWAFTVFAAAIGATVALAAFLHSRRELLAGILTGRSASRRRWRLRGAADLATRLGARRLAAWALAVVLLGSLFGSMASGLTKLIESTPTSAAYLDVAVPQAEPIVQYATLLTVVMASVVAVATVQRILALFTSEEHGLAEITIACGVSRTRIFLTALAEAIAVGFLLLLASGAAMAASTALQLSDEHAPGRAFVFAVSHLPGLSAAIGFSAGLVGAAPRWRSLAWALIAWSSFARIFGGFMDLPKWAQDLSILGHVADPWGTTHWLPMAVQLGVGIACCAGGLIAYRVRDIPA